MTNENNYCFYFVFSAGADVNAIDDSGATPVELLLHSKAIAEFIESNLAIDQQNNQGLCCKHFFISIFVYTNIIITITR